MSSRLRNALMFCLLAVGLMATTPLQAQTGATIHGNVVDPDDALIPGAVVTLTPVTGKAFTATSQSDGTYTFKGVPAGTYSLTSTAAGFGTFVKMGIRVTGAAALELDVKMALQEQTQVVQVTASTAQVSVDADSNASSTVIKGKDLEALSDDPDELSSELTALAGPAAGPNGGQIYVDGFTGGQLPPKSSIREIRVNQNPFSAQYDKVGFGRVEVFTKPGTDKFHGSASLQGNNSSFNSTNPFQGAVIPYHTIFFLGQVTGPLTKTASFTIGGSHRTIQSNSLINPIGFFATSATSTTLCNPVTTANCSYYANYPSAGRSVFVPQTRWDITPRIDLALGEKNTLTTRFQYESNKTENDGLGGITTLPTQAYNDGSTEAQIQVSDSQIVSSKIVNETRFEYQHNDAYQTPLTVAPQITVQGAFTGGGDNSGTSTTTSVHVEAQNYTSIALAKNFIRFGGRMRYNSNNLTSNANSQGNFTYSRLLDPCYAANGTTPNANCVNTTTPCSTLNNTANGGAPFSSYQCGIPSQFAIAKINTPTITGHTVDFGFYAEDDWKPRPNLSISAGIRYEAQNVINSTHDFAPRASISYGVPRKNGNPTTVLRGGFGVFYDRFALASIMNTYQNNGTAQVISTYLNPGAACTPSSISLCGNAANSRSTIYTLAPDLRSSYNLQGALGVDQQVGRIGTISANYLITRGNHQFLAAAFPLTTGASPTITGYNYQYGSRGVFNQNQLTINANVRTRYITMGGFYALSFANANTNGVGNFATNAYNPGIDYGRAAFNRKQFTVIYGSVTLPYKFTASPFLIAQSGNPYNVTTGTDVNNNSVYNDRPAFNPNVPASCSNAASFITPTPGTSYTQIPVNYCTAPGNFTLNMRVARTFGFGPKTGAAAGGQRQRDPARMGGMGGPGGPGGGGGGARGGGGGGPMGGGGNSGRKYNLTFGAQGSNIFNKVPLGTPVGTLTSSKFGQAINIGGRPFGAGSAVRVITLQATFNF